MLSSETPSASKLVKAAMKSKTMEIKEVDTDTLSPIQMRVHFILSSKWSERILGFSFLINGILVVLETDAHARGQEPAVWVDYINLALLVAYSMEISARFWVLRRDFFNSFLNIFDTVVIIGDLIIHLIQSMVGSMPSMSLLRVLRLVKILRSRDILLTFPEMHQMMKSLLQAASTIAWGGLTIFITLSIWSIIAVEFIHPLTVELARQGKYGSCERCSRAFSSVMASNLTFMQQLIAGDSWGEITIPLIEEYPYLIIYFAGVMMTVSLGIMNLITAIIVDRAAEARQDSLRAMAEKKDQDFRDAAEDLVRLFRDIDVDCNGTICKSELMEGFDTNQQFADTLRVMDVRKEDMETVFNIMDEDGSGDINYKEFAQQLHKMKTHDSHTLLIFIKFYVTEIRRKLSDQISLLEDEIKRDFDAVTSSLCQRNAMQPKDVEYCGPNGVSRDEAMPQVLPKHDEDVPPVVVAIQGMRTFRGSVQQQGIRLQNEFEQLRDCVSQELIHLRTSNEQTFHVLKDLLLDDMRWKRTSDTPCSASHSPTQPQIPRAARRPLAFQNCCSNIQNATGSRELVEKTPWDAQVRSNLGA